MNRVLPQFLQYVNPLLSALRKLGGAGRPQQVFQSITRELGLSPDLLEERLTSGGSRFENQVAWARWYLVNAGFIDGSRRGIWKLTDRGWASEFLSDDALRSVFEQTQAKYRGAGTEGEAEVPDTSADLLDIEKLKLLYNSDSAAQRFLEHAASRQRNQSETTVDRALQILRNEGHEFTRQQIVSMFQALEDCVCGQFIAGRRGWPSRFVWTTAMISVGRAATGEQEVVEQLGEEMTEPAGEKADWITHSFHLRPDVTLEFDLPTDLNAQEATRVARFIETLPFGDS